MSGCAIEIVLQINYVISLLGEVLALESNATQVVFAEQLQQQDIDWPLGLFVDAQSVTEPVTDNDQTASNSTASNSTAVDASVGDSNITAADDKTPGSNSNAAAVTGLCGAVTALGVDGKVTAAVKVDLDSFRSNPV